jgi:hypothetical protein
MGIETDTQRMTEIADPTDQPIREIRGRRAEWDGGTGANTGLGQTALLEDRSATQSIG